MIFAGHEVGELDDVEREIALGPTLAPFADEHGEERAILIRAAGIVFALIPDRSGERVGNDGEYAAVENRRGCVGIVGIAGRRCRSGGPDRRRKRGMLELDLVAPIAG